MLPITWRATARADLAEIVRFISESNPPAARRIAAVIRAAVQPTAEHPYLFKPGRVAGTREIVAHPNYLVVYRVAHTAIEVVSEP